MKVQSLSCLSAPGRASPGRRGRHAFASSLSTRAGHRSLIGRDPIIAVHDLDAIQQHYGNAGFHGLHLHLGILRTPRQVLTALQAFARFLRVHRESPDLETDIRSELRREGIVGTVEILLHKVPRVIGG